MCSGVAMINSILFLFFGEGVPLSLLGWYLSNLTNWHCSITLGFHVEFLCYNETTMNGQDFYLRIHGCDHPDITIQLYSGHLFRIILWYPTNTPINLIHNRFSSFLCYMKWTKIITNKSNHNKKILQKREDTNMNYSKEFCNYIGQFLL